MSLFDGEIRTGIAADPSGIAPKSDLVQGSAEYQRYEAVRAELDKPLQVAQVQPYFPQTDCRDPNDYRRQLLSQLVSHTQSFKHLDARYLADDKLSDMSRKIVADALNEPHRLGELREVKRTDRTGRTISEFVGKKTWFSQFKAPIAGEGIGINGVPRRPNGF